MCFVVGWFGVLCKTLTLIPKHVLECACQPVSGISGETKRTLDVFTAGFFVATETKTTGERKTQTIAIQ